MSTSEWSGLSSGDGLNAAITTWTYDAESQLLGEYRTETTPYRQTYTYDPAGNRTLKDIDGDRTTYAYDIANQLVYGAASVGHTAYQFDPNGNQKIEITPDLSRTTTVWDYENQPTQYHLPTGARVTYTYNADFRRVKEEA